MPTVGRLLIELKLTTQGSCWCNLQTARTSYRHAVMPSGSMIAPTAPRQR